MSKFHLITFGCQMNKSDSERLTALLENHGMTAVSEPAEADLILLNSCSVRQSAEDRIFGQIRNFAKLRKKNPRLVLGVTGCMAGRDEQGVIRRKLPQVDLFFPTKDMVRLPQWLAEHGLVEEAGETASNYLKIAPKYTSDKQAFVSIQTGCNNFCTYCVVPYARGMEKNRPAADIMQELKNLDTAGAIEVTLLGQTVSSYTAPDDRTAFSAENPYQNHFAALLWEINQLPGIQRIHFTAPHPNSMTDEVIDAMTLPKHVRYLHLPAQTGSNEMLRKMNRKCTRESMLEVFRKVKERLPDIAIGTDIIVGFCGETSEMFEETVSFYKEVDFDISYTARYSPRSGTPAWRAFDDDVTRAEKRRRWSILHELMEQTAKRKNQVYLGQTVQVLVESCEDGICAGYSEHQKLVRFKGETAQIGTMVPVKIETVHTWVLDGVATVPAANTSDTCQNKELQKQLP